MWHSPFVSSGGIRPFPRPNRNPSDRIVVISLTCRCRLACFGQMTRQPEGGLVRVKVTGRPTWAKYRTILTVNAARQHFPIACRAPETGLIAKYDCH